MVGGLMPWVERLSHYFFNFREIVLRLGAIGG